MKAALKKAHVGGDLDLDKLDHALAGLEDEDDNEDMDDGDDDGDEFTFGDALGKALALVNQVSLLNPAPRMIFPDSCTA